MKERLPDSSGVAVNDDVRALYLSTADSTIRLLADPAVGAAWDQPSALPEFSVRGLAGHLAAQVFLLPMVLAAEVPDGEPLSVFEYYSRAEWREPEIDLSDPVNVKARDQGEHYAIDGQDTLVQHFGTAAADLAGVLADEPADRIVRIPWADRLLPLDDFLVTRLLEMTVHADDLAVIVGIATPEADPAVLDRVLGLLLRLSVARHGQAAVLRALTRAERAPQDITAI